MKRLVSVIIPTLNRPIEIEHSIKSVIHQNYRPIELIVINDGGIDILNIVKKYNSKDVQVLYINNPINKGICASLNEGILHAKGEYIARIDDHDMWTDTNKLSLQVQALELHPELGVIGTGYTCGEKEMNNPITDTEIRKQMLFRSPFCHVSVVIRTNVLRELGAYNPNLSYGEDWDLWAKIGSKYKLQNLHNNCVHVTEAKDGSLSHKHFAKQHFIEKHIIDNYQNVYPNKTTAKLFHMFTYIFFNVIRPNSAIHNYMKRMYLFIFFRKKVPK